MTQGPEADADPLDKHRDPSRVALVRSLAAEVAAEYGVDLTHMQRANGYSNATWVGGGIAVKITHGAADMGREVALTRALPPEVGYPGILAEGTAQGHGWMVTTEIHGVNLQVAWPTLTPTEQARAVRQLWARAQVVHDASERLGAYVTSHGGFVPATHGDAVATVERATAALALSGVHQSRLRAAIKDYFQAASLVRPVVNHGDMALMNALWDGAVVALLDFEFALLGPIEVDLCRLVCEAGVSEDGEWIASKAAAVATEIAASQMDPHHGHVLIHGAAILDQVRDLDLWLARNEPEGGAADWRPSRLLTGLLDGNGGYLAALLR